MPETLARHFGHLFIRDPLVILKEYFHPTEDHAHSYHFEVCLDFILTLFFFYKKKFFLEFKFSCMAYFTIKTTTIR